MGKSILLTLLERTRFRSCILLAHNTCVHVCEQGKVVEAKVVYDKKSGRSRGFGFVTYSSPEEVDSAIKTFDGVELDGRPIRASVAESRPRRQF
ncbi:hypothetical protein V6N11_070389 [Hibiscus sabdariffa]|uniref:RRM domain-containing protein n=1 Tax=Hibiscus sabdariffa TaxID=183260 RepID=A0ABR2QEW5_9ROSI